MNVPYSRMELPELGERRLFVHVPGGILLELVFRETRRTAISETRCDNPNEHED